MVAIDYNIDRADCLLDVCRFCGISVEISDTPEGNKNHIVNFRCLLGRRSPQQIVDQYRELMLEVQQHRDQVHWRLKHPDKKRSRVRMFAG